MNIVIWDNYVRCFHWLIVALLPLNYGLFLGGDDAHNCIGYAIITLVCGRIVWGFIGSQQARFQDFLPTPTRLLHYATHFRQFHHPSAGHNPVGGLMIILLLFLLLLLGITGWMQTLDKFWGEEWVQNLHEYTSYVLLAAIAVHVIAVLIMQKITNLPLIKTMITGKRQMPD